METRFCYEIHADVGLSYDLSTGENASAFAEVKLQHNNLIDEESYKIAHEEEVLNRLSKRWKIEPKYIKPISIEEFDKVKEL